MSFLKRLASLGPSKPPAVTCPYCDAALDIEPERKRNCPKCGEMMYAKRRPDEQSKRFVTKEQADEVDAAWQEHRTQKRIASLREQLKEAQKRKDKYAELIARARLEAEQGDRDKAWRYFNQASLEAGRSLQGGLYYIARFEMAEFLMEEGRHKDAAAFFCEAAYLWYCRATNVGTDGRGRPLESYPPFEKYSYASLGTRYPGPEAEFPGGLVDRLQKAAEAGDISRDSLQDIFMDRAQIVHKSMKAPHQPQNAWKALVRAF